MSELTIIGGGPAGLTAALVGRKLGFTVRVYERDRGVLREGAGFVLQSNGLRVLQWLGLEYPNLARITEATLEDQRGHVLSRVQMSTAAIPLHYSAAVVRYEFQEFLFAAARAAGVSIEFGRDCTGARVEGDTAVVAFSDGETVRSGLVLACDGSRSIVRRSLGIRARERPSKDPHLSGISTVAGATSIGREIWGDDGRRFGLFPVGADRMYFFCTAPKDWERVRRDSLSDWLSSWNWGVDSITRTLAGITDWNVTHWDNLWEVRSTTWSKPPIFLVGDAAHAVTPNLGQGLNCAMTDALVLVRLLAADPTNMPAVAHRYEAVRRPIVDAIQSVAWRIGQMVRLRARIPGLRQLILKGLPMVGDPFDIPRLAAGYQPSEDEFFA